MADLSVTTRPGKQPARAPSGQLWRLVPLAFGALAMAIGLWTGLARLGAALPGGFPAIAEWHGALMISGFLGTVISLERAVALGSPWAYSAPAFSALGALALVANLPRPAALLFIAASALLSLASARIAYRHVALFTVVLTVAAVAWAIGNVLWLAGHAAPIVTLWWLNFLVLTIAAERLELSRLLRPPVSAQAAFAAAVLLLLVGAMRGELWRDFAPFTAIGLLASAAWLIHYDIARRTVRQSGQTRFSAICILAGHLWVGVAGALLLIAPPGASAFSYDAVVHALAIGTVLSMIFGHAPIILPAVIGVAVTYRAALYVPLALLHASLLLRIVADFLPLTEARTTSGMLTVLALVIYAATLALASRRRRSP